MKTASADLIALLESSKQLVMYEIYTITLADNTVLTWANGEVSGPTASGARLAAEPTVTLET